MLFEVALTTRSAYADQTPKKGRLWDNILRAASGAHASALLDQTVVSGASFLTMIMIGRWTNPVELGLYAIGGSVLLLVLAIEVTLISLPYTVQRGSPVGTPAEYAGNALVQCVLLSLSITVLLALAALGLIENRARPELVALIWTLAGVAPFVVLRDFGRNFAFAHLRAGLALRLDAAVAAMQLTMLGWLGWTGRLSSSSAYVAIGVACALSSIVWLYLASADFAICAHRLAATMKRNWTLAKWIFGVQITAALQIYLIYWLLAWLVGTRETGVYAACITVITLVNPLILGFGNILMPKAVLAFKEENMAGLRRQISWDLLLRSGPMALFCLVILFAGEDLLLLLYRNDDYAGHGHLITVLAFSSLALVISMPPNNALLAMEHPREIFRTQALAAALTVALVWSLVGEWGLLGAAYASLAGNVFMMTALWRAFVVLVAAHRLPKTVEPGLSKRVTRTAPVRANA
ncbi:MAG: hypothetical protein C5B58_14005 [Acidobacteria bacterium]|nr:MAG: hypothetical protein C5B58_14005 [Acidobacteriota bacterium]